MARLSPFKGSDYPGSMALYLIVMVIKLAVLRSANRH